MRWIVLMLCSFAAFTVAAESASTALITALKSGGHILLLRHAQTDPGVGDPSNFRLDDCSTQRNLSPEGRAQAKQIGVALKASGVRFSKVLTSQWCRCRETAALISVAREDFPALNSFFAANSTEPAQSREVRARARQLGSKESWLMVTHQVNITALTGLVPAMGEGVVVRVDGGKWTPLGTLRL